MPKQVIVSMKDGYPFGECEECTNQNTKVLVRRIYQVGAQERKQLLEKMKVIRRLSNQHMIRIESVLQEQQSIHVMFEYIPIKVETWISNINDQFIENFRDQLIKFSSFLANHYIKIQFHIKNVGMDHNYQAKYFLDLDFQIDPSSNPEKLKSTYIREITRLFQPYLMNSKSEACIENDREREGAESKQKKPSNVLFDVQPPKKQRRASILRMNSSNSRNKEKAADLYYQEMNISMDDENQKLMQEFMNVLGNQDEERQPEKSSPEILRSQPQRNQKRNPKETHNGGSVFKPNHLFVKKDKVSANAHSRSFRSDDKAQLEFQNPNSSVKHETSPDTRRHLTSFTHSVGKEKRETMDFTEFIRQSIYIQSRVKSVVQKSKSVLQRFKEISNILKP